MSHRAVAIREIDELPRLLRQGQRLRRWCEPQVGRGERMRRWQYRLERLFARQVY